MTASRQYGLNVYQCELCEDRSDCCSTWKKRSDFRLLNELCRRAEHLKFSCFVNNHSFDKPPMSFIGLVHSQYRDVVNQWSLAEFRPHATIILINIHLFGRWSCMRLKSKASVLFFRGLHHHSRTMLY